MILPDNVKVFTGITELSKAAADFILKTAKESVEQSGSFTIALSGGNTPSVLYKLLAQPPYKDAMPWQHTHVFWSDERCVALNDANNNAHQAKQILLDKVDIPLQNIHRIQVQLSPDEAATAYEHELQACWEGDFPQFDLILLGMGDDGHTASLFPGTAVLSNKVSLVSSVYLPKQNTHRITMMPRLINRAQTVLFLVSGKTKSKVVAEVLNPNVSDRYPVRLIQPLSGNMFWFVDHEAAADL